MSGREIDTIIRALDDLRQTQGVIITALEGLASRLDRIEAEGCRLRARRQQTGPHLPNLFLEGCGGGGNED